MDMLTLVLAKKYADTRPGPPGEDGSTWLFDEGIPAGELGDDSDFYLNTIDGEVYRKVDDSWSSIGNLTGPPGNDGAPGADGATWHSGEGEPGAVLGSNGDYYFEILGGEVYLKSAGSWVTIANLTGPKGDDGSLIGNYDGGRPASVYANLKMDGGGV